MSGDDLYPPPGYTPPPEKTTTFPVPDFAAPGQVPPGGPAYPPPGAPAGPPPPGSAPYPAPYPQQQFPGGNGFGPLVAAHKPGVIPLRPLSLGDIYDGAFKTIRRSPGATVGAAVLVSSVSMVIPLLLGGLIVRLADVSVSMTETEDSAAFTGLLNGTQYGGALVQALGLIFVTGIVSLVVAAATLGRRISLGEAWQGTHGKRWRLLGLSLFLSTMVLLMITVYVALWIPVVVVSDSPWPIVAWAVVTIPLFLCALVFVWTRVVYLAVPPLMLEPVGIFRAIGRAWELTGRAFWRTLGIGVLTYLVTQFAASIIVVPVLIVAFIAGYAVSGMLGTFLFLGLMVVAQVLATAFVAPFSAGVTSLQYIDLRMRKEAYDVQLMSEAGITAQ
ncbi:hypothetical protein [Nocardioides speluncae]|uniref:hypothetical protein n=1 Tax=Nocardioides speluncae TaxID=2670337 RepID=UPI0013799511|nr:hypothetical protein [Nocardioides speluncae]